MIELLVSLTNRYSHVPEFILASIRILDQLITKAQFCARVYFEDKNRDHMIFLTELLRTKKGE